MLIGAIAKAGSMPFHSWIPAAAAGAPASVMAMLPASLDKLLGIYLLVRLSAPGSGLFALGPGMSLLLMILGAVTIVVAVMVAMVQHDLKRLLSYHAISQVGYMVLGIGTLTTVGIIGGLFHMINNALYKNCLFLCAGSVERQAGTTELDELGGLGRRMPLTFAAALVAALAISGVPPLNGFVSKWMVYQGVIETGLRGSFVFLVAAMFGSALTLASFVKVVYSVFLGTPTAKTRRVEREVPVPMVFPMGVLALLCLLFGVYYRFPVAAFLAPATGASAEAMGIWSSGMATVLLVFGLLAGLLIYVVGRIGRTARTVPPFIGGEHLVEDQDRVDGTRFYETIRDAPLLKKPYEAQARGSLDPFRWVGGAGLAVTKVLRAMHTGLLSWYLSWTIAGTVALILVLLLAL
jgi:formate hydrogenlyase subunit 3/multisubunit Na+/H+ antiporter MnhD subunit